jgi:16S rRNA U516 pseudouridylate synthase RsuA-like enzyme
VTASKDGPLKTLDRVLSKAGAGSRLDAVRWVRAGRVKMNGTVVRNPDHWVDLKSTALVQFEAHHTGANPPSHIYG